MKDEKSLLISQILKGKEDRAHSNSFYKANISLMSELNREYNTRKLNSNSPHETR